MLNESQMSECRTVSACSVSVSCSLLAPAWLLAELGLLTVTALQRHNGLTVQLALRGKHRKRVFVFWREDSHSQPEQVCFCHLFQQHLCSMTYPLGTESNRTVCLFLQAECYYNMWRISQLCQECCHSIRRHIACRMSYYRGWEDAEGVQLTVIFT